MENNYRKLMEEIVVPEGLEDRVLYAARRQKAEQVGPKHLARSHWKHELPGAVCAASAQALEKAPAFQSSSGG